MTWIGARLYDLRNANAKCNANSVTEPTQAELHTGWHHRRLETATILLKQALPTLAAAVAEWEHESESVLYREIEAHIAKMEGGQWSSYCYRSTAYGQ